MRLANRNTLWASVFAEELFRSGLRVVCISPGSRSTPLAMAFAHHPQIHCYALLDERSAGFFAVGHGKTTGVPTALLCTSGSAGANYFPAVLEAFHARSPLLVLTADRPPQLRDTGAGQAIDQLKLFGDAVRWFFEVGLPEMSDTGLRHLRTLAGRAFHEASLGPVHLNFPFHKPLEPTPTPGDGTEALARDFPLAVEGLKEGAFSRAAAGPLPPPPEEIEKIGRMVRGAPRGLIVCGPMLSPREFPGGDPAPWREALADLALHTGYPVLAEPGSQARSGPHDRTRFLAHGEAILRAGEFREQAAPQLVLRFGAMPTAKHVEVLLEENPTCPVVLISHTGAWLESTHNPTLAVRSDPALFCRALAEGLSGHTPDGGGDWLGRFRQAEQIAGAAIGELLDENSPDGLGGDWFEGWVFAELGRLLPADSLQFTASSMPVRDLDAFTPSTDRAVHHLVNRGVNGIDGTLSSALGAAAAWKQKGRGPAVLVLGDLAFFHDANGLLAAKQHGIDLTVILINNHGGGIFEMLPIAKFGETYETFFATPHEMDFHALTAAYGVELYRPENREDFRGRVADSLKKPGTQIIEIVTRREENRLRHQQVWKTVAERLARG